MRKMGESDEIFPGALLFTHHISQAIESVAAMDFCLNAQKTSNGFSRDIAASITAQCEAYGDKRSVFGQRCI